MVRDFQGWLNLVAGVSSAGVLFSGVLGALVVAQLGPSLAMGLAIWSGQTTEPVSPDLGYPWFFLVVGVLGWLVGLAGRTRGKGFAILLHGSAVGVALLPWIQLWRLWGMAA